MLSILIPIYNFDIRALVRRLHEQGEKLELPFEIIAVEDGSHDDWVALNKELEELENVVYEVLKQNLGRSKVRNYLATKAKYKYLLFMDCDSMPVSDRYLQNYTQNLHPEKLLYGGRSYQKQIPPDAELFFHWHYGKKREETPASTRQLQPYQSFMTNNFLIPKSVFEKIGFDEQLTQYGHEDTLFGLELKNKNIEILHLDNQLEHIGIEKNIVFIKKSEQAIQNLHFLYKKNRLPADAVKLLRFYNKFKKLHITFMISIIFKILKKAIVFNLCSSFPKLYLFDFYKLGYLCSIESKS